MCCDFVDSKWSLCAFGSNSSGQLGTGSLEDHHQPTICTFAIPTQTFSTELNCGNTLSNKVPVPVCLKDKANSESPIIVSGANHSFLYWKNLPLLYGCGSISEGELGPFKFNPPTPLLSENNTNCIPVWHLLETPSIEHPPPTNQSLSSHNHNHSCPLFQSCHNISQISVGWNHSILLTSSGNLFSTGNNSFGQCGFPSSKSPPLKNCWNPIYLFSLYVEDPIIRISSGLRHSVAISKNGIVFGWGSNSKNQLYPHIPPSLIQNSNVSNVPSSFPDSSSSIADPKSKITNIPSSDPKSAKGTRPKKQKISKILPPTILISLENIIDVACGRNHTALITFHRKGCFSLKKKYSLRLYSTGSPHIFSNLSCSLPIQQLNTTWSFLDISPFFSDCLSSNALYLDHSLLSSWDSVFVLSKKRNDEIKNKNKNSIIFAFGSSKLGTMGPNNPNDSKKEIPIDTVSQNPNNPVIMSSNSPLNGSNLEKNIFSVNLNIQSLCSNSSLQSFITEISCGSYHVIARTNTNDVVCWGWNEHGNCGVLPTASDTNSAQNEIICWPPVKVPCPDYIITYPCHVFSGYATSFIVFKQ
ncbi:hypothetical protein BB560_004913 [Smittium megazygosporum]|uniref:Uncharacterized protein n=1 Tax=Smittium megazygosporum TaxID=133381 RepID=A0A2T9Z7W7_9FUNG|nr:hypothetical protein BB560_004913 [Smittium megazygosporum]